MAEQAPVLIALHPQSEWLAEKSAARERLFKAALSATRHPLAPAAQRALLVLRFHVRRQPGALRHTLALLMAPGGGERVLAFAIVRHDSARESCVTHLHVAGGTHTPALIDHATTLLDALRRAQPPDATLAADVPADERMCAYIMCGFGFRPRASAGDTRARLALSEEMAALALERRFDTLARAPVYGTARGAVSGLYRMRLSVCE